VGGGGGGGRATTQIVSLKTKKITEVAPRLEPFRVFEKKSKESSIGQRGSTEDGDLEKRVAFVS